MAAQPTYPSLRDDEQLLVRARELVDGGWCRNALAEDRGGRQVEPWSDSACRWSPLGALLRAWYERRGNGSDPFGSAYLALALATGGRVAEWGAASWRTKRHVVRAFGRAREYLPEARELERGPTPPPEGADHSLGSTVQTITQAPPPIDAPVVDHAPTGIDR